MKIRIYFNSLKETIDKGMVCKKGITERVSDADVQKRLALWQICNHLKTS
jgi:hypothetical protein